VFYVYVLQSLKDGKFYIGFTAQYPTERLKDHNTGGKNSTSKRRPFKLLYYEAHTSEMEERDILRKKKEKQL
jgi:putative endonuclease